MKSILLLSWLKWLDGGVTELILCFYINQHLLLKHSDDDGLIWINFLNHTIHLWPETHTQPNSKQSQQQSFCSLVDPVIQGYHGVTAGVEMPLKSLFCTKLSHSVSCPFHLKLAGIINSQRRH